MKMEIRGRVFHGNILPLLWTFTPEFGTIVVVSLYTNEEILCTGRIKNNWVKHLDFMILDLICLQVAFFFSLYITT